MKKSNRFRMRASSCGTGCLGVLVLCAVVGSIWYSRVGHYRPYIPPPPPLPVPNGLDDYAAAGALLQANGGLKTLEQAEDSLRKQKGAVMSLVGQPPDKILLPVKQALVAMNPPALARMRQGFTKVCRVPASRSQNDVFPYLSGIRALGRLLAIEAELSATKEDHAGAWTSGLDAIQMGEEIAHGGLAIHLLAGISIQATQHPVLVHSLEYLTAAECDEMIARLQGLLLRQSPLSETIRAERDMTLSFMRILDDQNQWADLGIRSSGFQVGIISDAGTEKGVMGAYTRALWHLQRDTVLREVESTFEAARREADKPAILRKPLPQPKTLLGQLFGSIGVTWSRPADTVQAHNRLLLCALAIRRYRLIQGRLPDTLNELGLDTRLLQDPFTGEPLIYKPGGRNYLLYSVGPDLKDDGGLPLLIDKSASGSGDLGIMNCRREKRYDGKTGAFLAVPHMLLPIQPKTGGQ